MKQRFIAKALAAGVTGLALVASASAVASKSPQRTPTNAIHADGPGPLESSVEGKALRETWTKAGYGFTPEVKAAYLAFAKAGAMKDLQAAGKVLPADFLAWIDGDPAVAATVYGARIAPANVLLMLRSLELDLGTEAVRQKYTQLALAMAVVHAGEGPRADLSTRPLLKLVIPACPLKPVNTKDPGGTLDVNDHIINFLNEHSIQDVPADRKWTKQASELAYDGKGVAVAGPGVNDTPAAPADKVKRPLTAADVMADAELQKQFNAYMKAHGQDVRIDCGDHVIYPDRHDMVKGPEAKPILDAFHLFKTAYEAKGLLPAGCDPAPTPAESCAFLIRNDECKTPAVPTAKKLPHCPLTAPWPALTLLAADSQPLREREDIWERYHDHGEVHTYGEYIGGIAQQFDFQSARRLSPYPFGYGTFQMMLKDGGVCGTMANIGVRTYESLGIPACTAGQPGHCALILFEQEPKTATYQCQGGQFATGGPAQTHPHTPFYFGDVDEKRDMVYHQSIAWAINAGLSSYLDSTIAFDVYRVLSEADRSAHGQALLESGLSINPYNFLLADAGTALAPTPEAQIHFWKSLKASLALAAAKPGCPADSLYSQTVRGRCFAALARMPVPGDKSAANAIYVSLREEKCDNEELSALYESAVDGLPSLLARTEADFKAHLASARSETSCEKMAAELQAAANNIPEKARKAQWLASRWEEIQGHEAYFGRRDTITIDATASTLAKLAGKKLSTGAALNQPLLDQVTLELKAEIAGDRDLKSSRQTADRISAVARQCSELAEVRPWLQGLSSLISGHEQFTPKHAKNTKPVRDPCADTIAQLLAPSPGAKKLE